MNGSILDDLSNKLFGRLIVLHRVPNNKWGILHGYVGVPVEQN